MITEFQNPIPLNANIENLKQMIFKIFEGNLNFQSRIVFHAIIVKFK